MSRLGKYLLVIAVSSLGIFLTQNNAVLAASASDWKAGYIADDRLFFRGTDLSVDQIQQFLNSKMPSCDTQGAIGPYYDRNGTRWDTRADFGRASGSPPPYTCLKSYSVTFDGRSSDSFCQSIPGGTKNAAAVIYEVSRACGISARALIVMLEKEQGLVRDDWPWPIQYRGAMGYGCPDTAPCDSQYYGLFNQVYNAARQFKVYAAYPDSYRHKPFATKPVYWNPDTGRCGESNVYIESKATAGLYNYTPYQPNQAAVDAVYGNGDNCSAYGNRNFFNYFTDWFGSPRIQILASFAERYSELGGESGVLGKVTANQVCGLRNDGCYQSFEKGGLYWSMESGTFESYGPIRQRYLEIGTENGLLGYPNERVICGLKDGGCYQRHQKGVMYYSPKVGKAFENNGSIRERYVITGAESGHLGYPTSPKICGLKNGGCYQGYEAGAIYWSAGSGTFDVHGAIRQRYMAMLSESSPLGYPTSKQICGLKNGGCVQYFQYGKIYINPTDSKGYEILGSTIKRYDSLRNENGAYGYPSGSRQCSGNGCRQSFQGGMIYTPVEGPALIINNKDIENRWLELSAQDGMLGHPTNETACGTKNNGCYQFFKNGSIFYSPSTGAKSVWGGIYQKWSTVGKEWGSLGYPVTNELYFADGAYQDFEHGRIYWTPQKGAWVEQST